MANAASYRSRSHHEDLPLVPHPAFDWADDHSWRVEAERNATKRQALAARRAVQSQDNGLVGLFRRMIGATAP